jgi:DNA replication and repair protein RecF
MAVRRLHARDFRNLEDAELELGGGITLVVGANGAGKTNLLEALYFGLTGASWRTRAERELIRFGADLARVEVEVGDGAERRDFTALAQRGEGRRRRIDGNPVTTGPEELAARPPVGVFSPDRLELIKGPPAVRRTHLDRLVKTLWPARAESRRRYGQALAQRNALLGRVRAGVAGPSALEAWDAELAIEGVELIATRRDAVATLATWFGGLAETLGLEGKATLRYAPRSDATSAAELAAELRERRGSDVQLARTTCGPHLDEVQITLENRALRRYGSQGEQRAALLALLFSEREALLETTGSPPLMLLDDVMSELDPARRGMLTERLAAQGQTLMTATERAQVPELCERSEVRVHDGDVSTLALAA